MPGRCNSLLLRGGILCTFVFALGACTAGGQFDPTTLLDNNMFSSKTVIKGKREPVFPNGVPGVSTGIPPDLVKGYQPPPEQAAVNGDAASGAATPAPEHTAEAKPKPKAKPKPRLARARPEHRRTKVTVGIERRNAARRRPVENSQSSASASSTASTQGSQSSSSIWPSPPSTTQSQSAQSSQSVWPAPPSTTQSQSAQSSQSVWPAPPPTGGGQ
jgi:hypothetical protein